MRYLKLNKEDLVHLFEVLGSKGEVHAPVKRGRFYAFERVSSLDKASLTYNRTILPPKKYFVHPCEKIMTLSIGEGYFQGEVKPRGTVTLFGLHACDINGLRVLDSVYLDDPPDPLYVERRRNTIIVGVSCDPDDHCFCKSMGTDYAWTGFDLFLHDIGTSYLIRVGSPTGEAIIESLRKVVVEPGLEDIAKLRDAELKRSSSFKKNINASHLPDVVELLHDSEVWVKFSEKCLGCGSCNLVCPTCRCYDVSECLDLNLNEGARFRTWDSCFLRSHALVAGGLNFRPTRLDRFRHRYNCKSSMNSKTGLMFCVGCGRCSVFCPAGIDHVDVLNSLWGVK